MPSSSKLWRGAFVLALMCLAALAARAEPPPKPPEFVPGSWTLVLLPDTQVYSERYPGLFTLQTHWIARNKDKYNIRYVLQLGDITNDASQRQWQRTQAAMSELDGQVPYAIAPGNHDYGPKPAGEKAERFTLLNKYFPLAKCKSWPTFGGALNGDMCNTYHLFQAGDAEWIVLALEFAPRDETVQWANAVLAKYPRRKAILATHAYLYSDGTRYDFARKKSTQSWNPHEYYPKAPINDGEELWEKLVRKNNFALTFNGHVLGRGVGFLSSKNDRGQTTHQMLVNYQMRQLGGEGYLRLIEFLPDGKTVHVKSYSPLYDSYLQDEGNQFSFELGSGRNSDKTETTTDIPRSL